MSDEKQDEVTEAVDPFGGRPPAPDGDYEVVGKPWTKTIKVAYSDDEKAGIFAACTRDAKFKRIRVEQIDQELSDLRAEKKRLETDRKELDLKREAAEAGEGDLDVLVERRRYWDAVNADMIVGVDGRWTGIVVLRESIPQGAQRQLDGCGELELDATDLDSIADLVDEHEPLTIGQLATYTPMNVAPLQAVVSKLKDQGRLAQDGDLLKMSTDWDSVASTLLDFESGVDPVNRPGTTDEIVARLAEESEPMTRQAVVEMLTAQDGYAVTMEDTQWVLIGWDDDVGEPVADDEGWPSMTWRSVVTHMWDRSKKQPAPANARTFEGWCRVFKKDQTLWSDTGEIGLADLFVVAVGYGALLKKNGRFKLTDRPLLTLAQRGLVTLMGKRKSFTLAEIGGALDAYEDLATLNLTVDNIGEVVATAIENRVLVAGDDERLSFGPGGRP